MLTDRKGELKRGEIDQTSYVSRTATVLDLTGGVLPKRGSLSSMSKPSYADIAQRPVTVISEPLGEVFFVFAPPLTGLEAFHILNAAKPSNMFAYDIGDLFSDWKNLFASHNKERLGRHREIPGWQVYENERELVYGTIKASDNGENSRKLIPVMSFKKTSEGITWDYTSPPEDAIREYRKAAGLIEEETALAMSLGPAFLAAYSPDVTTKWPKEEKYPAHPAYRAQDMGSTQVLIQALWHADTLLGGAVFHTVRTFEETGVLPEIKQENERTQIKEDSYSDEVRILATEALKVVPDHIDIHSLLADAGVNSRILEEWIAFRKTLTTNQSKQLSMAISTLRRFVNRQNGATWNSSSVTAWDARKTALKVTEEDLQKKSPRLKFALRIFRDSVTVGKEDPQQQLGNNL